MFGFGRVDRLLLSDKMEKMGGGRERGVGEALQFSRKF
jgi:hypothetical protein